MTFDEVDYLTWCIKALSETDSPYWRMERLVKWASAQGYCKTMKTSGPVKSPHDSRSFLNWISNKDHDFQLGRLAGDEGQGQSQGNDEASRGDPTATGGLRLRRRESHDAKKIQQLEEENADLHRQHSRDKDRREM